MEVSRATTPLPIEGTALSARGALLERSDVARLLFRVLTTLIVAALAAVAVSVYYGDNAALIAALTVLLTAPLLLRLLRAKSESLAALGTAVLLLMVAIFVVTQGQGLFDVGMLIFPGVIVVSGLLLEQRFSTLMSVLTVISAIAVGVCDSQGLLPNGVLRASLRDVFNAGIVLAAVAAFVRILTNALYRGLHRAYRTEAEQSFLRDQIIESEQLRTVGQLAGGIAHDFNNQLTGIMASASMLEFTLPPGESKQRGHVEMILRCATRSADLTRELLAFARHDKTPRRAIDSRALIEDVLALLRRSIDKRIIIEQRLASDELYTLGDPSLLENALLNLALNARDAMPSGGRLCVQTKVLKVEAGPKPSAVPANLGAGEYIQLSVSDTGFGMDAETRTHIFEPFFTTKAKGHGMGLAAVYGTVQSHGGGISVESAPGQGTTFYLFLPRCEPPSDSDRESVITKLVHPSEREFAGARVLLGEDEPDVAQVIAGSLEQMGISVETCGDGQSALNQFRKSPDAFDLVILDQMMPRLSGAQVLTLIRAERVSIPVLFTSGYTGEDEAVSLSPGDEFLHKPFSAKDVQAVVRKLLRRKLRRANA